MFSATTDYYHQYVTELTYISFSQNVERAGRRIASSPKISLGSSHLPTRLRVHQLLPSLLTISAIRERTLGERYTATPPPISRAEKLERYPFIDDWIGTGRKKDWAISMKIWRKRQREKIGSRSVLYPSTAGQCNGQTDRSPADGALQ